MSTNWFVYMLRCSDDSLYTGITIDPKRRVDEHNGEAGGAKYTRPRRPVELVYQEKCKDRSDAAQKEARLKMLTKDEKERFLKR